MKTWPILKALLTAVSLAVRSVFNSECQTCKSWNWWPVIAKLCISFGFVSKYEKTLVRWNSKSITHSMQEGRMHAFPLYSEPVIATKWSE